jgi:hypothetical protein
MQNRRGVVESPHAAYGCNGHARRHCVGTVHARTRPVVRTENNSSRRERGFPAFRLAVATLPMDVTRKQRFVLNPAVLPAIRRGGGVRAPNGVFCAALRHSRDARGEITRSGAWPCVAQGRGGRWRATCKTYSVCKKYVPGGPDRGPVFPFYRPLSADGNETTPKNFSRN